MRIDSVRSIKAEVSAEIVAASAGDPAARSFLEATPAPMPSGVALGVSRDGAEYRLAIRTASRELAAPLVERARGEADVRILTVAKRPTWAERMRGRRRPLEPGAQIAMAARNFVGTLGAFVRDAAGVLYALTNAHVAADEGIAQPGHPIGQPFGTLAEERIGVLARFVPLSTTAPNLVDAAIVRLDKPAGLKSLAMFNQAIPGEIAGTYRVTGIDVGREVVKVGRTTGVRKGRITAAEIDGLPVAYDRGTLRFNDQIEVSGGPGGPEADFSAPGDSGSAILVQSSATTGRVAALLFAGGKDSTGEDFTYANPIDAVLSALGVQLA